jgi:hypothetical protein
MALVYLYCSPIRLRTSELIAKGSADIRIHTGTERVSGIVVFLRLCYAPGMGEHAPLLPVKIFSFFECFLAAFMVFFRFYIKCITLNLFNHLFVKMDPVQFQVPGAP